MAVRLGSPAKPAHCTTSFHPYNVKSKRTNSLCPRSLYCKHRSTTAMSTGRPKKKKIKALCLCSGHLENHVGMVYKLCYNTGYEHSKYVGRASYNTHRCRPLQTLSSSTPKKKKPHLLRHRSNQTPGNNFQHPSSQILLKPARKR